MGRGDHEQLPRGWVLPLALQLLNQFLFPFFPLFGFARINKSYSMGLSHQTWNFHGLNCLGRRGHCFYFRSPKPNKAQCKLLENSLDLSQERCRLPTRRVSKGPSEYHWHQRLATLFSSLSGSRSLGCCRWGCMQSWDPVAPHYVLNVHCSLDVRTPVRAMLSESDGEERQPGEICKWKRVFNKSNICSPQRLARTNQLLLWFKTARNGMNDRNTCHPRVPAFALMAPSEPPVLPTMSVTSFLKPETFWAHILWDVKNCLCVGLWIFR